MTNSLFSGVSGLSSYQKMLEVIGGNMANINTPGFKAGSFRAVENFSQTIKEAAAPNNITGGTNPVQVGGGANIGAIVANFGQGNFEQTGRNLDLAIEGEGFFVLNGGEQNLFSRVGSFALDEDSQLVDQISGFKVIDVNNQPITINTEEPLPPSATSQLGLQGNLDPTVAIPAGTVTLSSTVVDPQGASHTADITFTHVAADQWDAQVSLPNGDGVVNDADITGLTFNPDGSFASVADNAFSITFNGFATPQTVTLDFGNANSFNGVTQVSGATTIVANQNDGFSSSPLIDIGFDAEGQIIGQYSNGERQALGQIGIATFSNPEGLEKVNGNMFSTTGNSGEANITGGLTGRAGAVLSGNLETSNVDTSKEIALMIIAQRGFQFNARVITASNEILQEAANLIR
ncbi:flagellar hook protein FlgE [Candidatus Uabimicrobium amorphum]|uniref:Flagellar hook protein FlgE n=1 Tax=Uabimicrobium amorphum TaxID=2596890 RepID=A0A5S9IN96_UABAM|nr:flagellar hook-basal body complex protein [Candidatus Uabimicrobium amorphum]BBM84989.1 flagellar hook protein FlgE [Candidatus Uabimicrobium amorphum]